MKIPLLMTALIVSVIMGSVSVTQADSTKGGYLASPSQELLEKAFSYLADKDQVAFDKLIATGTVFPLKGGLDVQIVETKFFSGLVKIRPRGETFELWTNIEAIQN